MHIDFCKYHGLGNDYIVIDPNKTDFPESTELVRRICHRNFGPGSDGILLGPTLNGGKIGLRILNPDGSEAEKSGNGLRIFARYLFDTGYVKNRKFSVVTLGGTVHVEIIDDQARLIRIDMGVANFVSDSLPVSGPAREILNQPLTIGDSEYHISCVSMGNPHCVALLPAVSAGLAREIGPLLEHHAIFPRRTNVQFMKVLDRSNIQIEIWERGAGYTLASGSSSCAAASVAHRLGLTGPAVKVHMPGGVIDIDIRADKHVLMTGPVAAVVRGTLPAEFFRDAGL